MKKQRVTDRFQLLNKGRYLYLEFLRNLTPQIILFSILLLLMGKIDFTRFDISNWLPTLLFFFLLGSFFLAFYANATTFYERCFEDFIKWRSDLYISLKAQGLKGFRLYFNAGRVICRERLIDVLEMMVVFWFFNIALAIVVIMALSSASGIWEATHHRT